MNKNEKEEFPSNSIMPPKKVKKVTTGTVRKAKEKPAILKFFEKNLPEIGNYVMWEVIVPTTKSLVQDVVTNFIEMALYGDSSPKRKSLRRDRDSTHVSYSHYYDQPRGSAVGKTRSRSARQRTEFDDILFQNRSDAEAVLSHMVEIVDNYGMASVADFFELAGVQKDFMDRKFGWDDLRHASVEHIRGGWVLDLPNPLPLD